MEEIDFSQIKTYEKLQDYVFDMKTLYSKLQKRYDFELAYKNKFNLDFIWKNIDSHFKVEEIKMNQQCPMDLGEVIAGPSNVDGGKRLRFDPVPPSGEEIGPGRPYRQGKSRKDYNEENSYNFQR